MSLSFIEVASGQRSTGGKGRTRTPTRSWQALGRCPLAGGSLWALGAPRQAGAGREPQAGPLGPAGGALRLADGVQSMGQGLHLVLDAVQGAPDGVGTVQHVDGQCVRVKLHREGALDAGGVAPVGRGGGGSQQGPTVTSGAGPEGGGPSPPSQQVQRPQDFSEPLGPPKACSVQPPRQVWGPRPPARVGGYLWWGGQAFSKRTSTRHSIPPCSFPREA